MGAANLKATVIDTEPLAGSGRHHLHGYSPAADKRDRRTQVTGASVYEYTEASFHFYRYQRPLPRGQLPDDYAWYKAASSSAPTRWAEFHVPDHAADNGVQIYAVRQRGRHQLQQASPSQRVVTLTVNPAVSFTPMASSRNFSPGPPAPMLKSETSAWRRQDGYRRRHDRRLRRQPRPPLQRLFHPAGR